MESLTYYGFESKISEKASDYFIDVASLPTIKPAGVKLAVQEFLSASK